MFQGDVTLRGLEATVVWVYQTAAVCRSWTAHRTPQGRWTLRADVSRGDPFRLRQQPLLFRAPRKGGYFVWPVLAVTLVDHHLSATLGPPMS
jgi:hypothetical protein